MAPSKGAKNTKRLNANIDVKKHQNFRIACMKNSSDMTEVIDNFITRYIELTNRKETRNEH